MCLKQTIIYGLDRYNWDGDEIVPVSVVPSSRPVVGVPRSKNYRIDVREFLITDRNDVIKGTLQDEVKKFVETDMKSSWSQFTSRKPGSFDFRANVIASYVSSKISYASKGVGKPWLFPDETLFVKEGDCEDRAFLIASLMLASGISGYNVRVALGKVKVFSGNTLLATFDHMWVMYKNERGQWLLFEPLHVHTRGKIRGASSAASLARKTTRSSYIPMYIFNDTHLWKIHNSGEKVSFAEQVGKDWSKLNPTFAGEVHKTIVDTALDKIAPQWFIDGVNRHFSRILGISPVVDYLDNLLKHAYNPFDHFDNAYIKESWDLVNQRLDSFNKNNNDIDDFSYAAHSIADFYAHTSYVHFASLVQRGDPSGYATLCVPSNPTSGLESLPDYSIDSTFDLTSDRYSVNSNLWTKPKEQIPGEWNGAIISGRYAQSHDSHGLLENFAYMPDALQKDKDFYKRGSLPHHNEIAVDDAAYSKDHKLYSDQKQSETDRMSFANQFRWRSNSATLHVRKAFTDNWHPPSSTTGSSTN